MVDDLSQGAAPEAGPPEAVVSSAALMKGQREIVIVHAGLRYRLRITANDKLILTK
ncbi:hemin uptake protein HemP [Methylorubrum zatmanii]|uniref:Hemin uptake protein HemP n=1 Tax=Methylorubrum zatmanii TaxID=29429 RepID=A0ABW1WWJ5_9HYPH|nr:hemin uptake protein HemP [Methylorubrum zatmanii]